MGDSSLNVHLHCAQCDAELGIFQNQWIHLTPSYARPKERGMNMGCRIGSNTQIVPQGPTQKEAAGCLMVELFCESCSAIVGQSCKTAPTPEQQSLLNQRFFKLSRIYLTNVKDRRREDPVFVDAENAENPSRSTSVRSGLAPSQRAESRGGKGPPPPFRQSYPPSSSHLQQYDQYQVPHNMPPPRQSFHQVPPSPSPIHIHYAPPPPSEYSYSHLASRHQSDAPEPHPPVLMNGMLELQQEVKGHATSILDSFNRIASVERRLASDEGRASDAERRSIDVMERMRKSELHTDSLAQQIKALEDRCEAQSSTLELTQERDAAREFLIKAQAEQIVSLSEKLAELQATMQEFKVQLEDVRSQPLIQQNSQPDSSDFLGNLEVLVRAMRSAQTSAQEVEHLREQNRDMEKRLEKFHTDNGSAPGGEAFLLEDSSDRHGKLESAVLGKRKRDGGDDETAGQRKSTKPVTSVIDQDQSLPTPESTQIGQHSLDASYGTSVGSEDPLALPEGNSLLNDEPELAIEDSLVSMVESDHEVASTEKPDHHTASDENRPLITRNSDANHSTLDTVQKPSESRLAPPDIHQAHAVNANAQQALSLQPNHRYAYFFRESSVTRDNFPEASPSSFLYRSMNTSRNKHPARPQGLIGNASSIQSPGMGSAIRKTTTPLSNSQNLSQGSSDAQARQDQGGSEQYGPFSYALSRGQRLEDTVMRSSRTPSAYLSDKSSRPDVTAASPPTEHLSHVDDYGPNLPAFQHSSQHRRAEFSHNDGGNPVNDRQVIEFSDEENDVPIDKGVLDSHHIQQGSTTPFGEPRSHQLDRAEAFRTLRELTQEPLRRPVIMAPSPVPHALSRRTSYAQQCSILPSVAIAIQNLNGSADRHKASTPARSAEAEVAIDDRGRVHESVLPVPPSRDAEPGDTPADTNALVLVENRPSDSTSSIALESIQGSREKPMLKSRGRPRKVSMTTRREAMVDEATSGNDDICGICKKRGRLICCDGCPKSYHLRCMNMTTKQVGDGDWYCPQCTLEGSKQKEPEAAPPRTEQNDAVIMMRRRLAEEAMARDMAQKV